MNGLGACSWGYILLLLLLLRGGGSGGGTSLPQHPRPLRRVHLSLLYKPAGCRELGGDIGYLLLMGGCGPWATVRNIILEFIEIIEFIEFIEYI